MEPGIGVIAGEVGQDRTVEDIGRAPLVGAGVVVQIGSDHDGVPVDGHGVAEEVARRGVAGRYL